jgi:NADH dehydrogenase
MTKKILVVGGTGMLGWPVARKLAQNGHKVSILTRDPNKTDVKGEHNIDFIEGDVRSNSSLRRVMRGFEGIHINLNSHSFRDLEEIEVKGTANVAKAAVEGGVKKITMISGLGVMEKNAWSPMVRAKLDSEKALKMSGLAYTIFNCTHFMETIPMYIRNKKAVVFGKQHHAIHWLAADDYASIVGQAFNEPRSDHKKIPVLGTEKLTMEEAFKIYIEHQSEGITLSHMSLQMLTLISNITFNKNLKYVVSMMKYFEKVPEAFSREDMPDYFEKPSTTLEDWIKKPENRKQEAVN